MKLYYSPGACSLAPHIVLRDTGLPFTLEKVDLDTHKTAQGIDHYTVNPKGAVPVLELDDGARLTEGPIITQYIADQAGRTDLIPAAGSLARYRVMEWQNYVTSELHKSFSVLFNPAFDATAKKTMSGLLHKKYEWVNRQLEGKRYLTGETFTVADPYLFVVTSWAKFLSLDLSGLSHLQACLAQIAERPAVAEAMQAEGLNRYQ